MRDQGGRLGDGALAGEQLHARRIAGAERAQRNGKSQRALGKQGLSAFPRGFNP